MTKVTWRDEDVERHLRNLNVADGLTGVPGISPRLLTRTRERLHRHRPRRPWAVGLAAASFMLALLVVPASLLATEEPILGIQVRISDMSPARWIRQGFSGWLASPGSPEFLSPAETAQVAPFPIRTPSWLPEGYVPTNEPQGAFGYIHQGGRWRVSEDLRHFFVSQSFHDPEAGADQPGLSVMHKIQPVVPELTMAPGTELLQVAGYPVFLELDVPLAVADEASEARSRLGQRPEIVGHTNRLLVWVDDQHDNLTAITISGPFSREVLVRVAESLFD